MTYKITESDAIDGTTIEREATAQEVADIEARNKKITDLKKAEDNAEKAKASAMAKLAALGLTPEEISAIS